MKINRKKIHVLLCLSRLGIGGIQTFVLLHAHYLKSKGIHVSIYSYYPELSYRKDFKQLDPEIPIYTLSKNEYVIILINHIRNLIKRFLLSQFDFKEYLTRRYLSIIVKSKGVTLIHSNIHITDRLGIYLKKKYRIPLLISSHGSYNGKIDSDTISLMKELSHFADAFVYTSTNNIQNFYKYKIELKNSEFIPNGYSRGEVRQQVNTDHVVFGIMSRGVEEKGWRELRQAIDILNNKEANFELKVIADGELPKELFTEVSNVDFVGETLDYEKFLIDCDVCLLPSFLREESMPFAIITYLSLSKPVIASDIGEIRWMITHDGEEAGDLMILDRKSGRIDPNDLAKRMEIYLNDPSLLKEKSRIANLAFSKFDISTTGRKYIDLYYSMIDR